MLSRESVRKINGLPNEVDTIEKFIEDHPELQREERNTKIEEWLAEGIRGAGSQTKQRVDSYTHALKQPSTYAWAGAITAASIMAAPFTGGTSLAAGGALLATSPLVAGTATSKAIAMLLLKSRYGFFLSSLSVLNPMFLSILFWYRCRCCVVS